MSFYDILSVDDVLHCVVDFLGVELFDIAAVHRTLLPVSKEMSEILLRFVQYPPLKIISSLSESITHRREVVAWACKKKVTLAKLDLRLATVTDVNIFHYVLEACNVSLLRRLALDLTSLNLAFQNSKETPRDVLELEKSMIERQGFPSEVHRIEATETTESEFLTKFWNRLTESLSRITVVTVSMRSAFDDNFVKFCVTSPHAKSIEELILDLPDSGALSFESFTNAIDKMDTLRELTLTGSKGAEYEYDPDQQTQHVLSSESLEKLCLEDSELYLAELNCPNLQVLCGRDTNGVRPFPHYTPYPEDWEDPTVDDSIFLKTYVPDGHEIRRTEALPRRHIVMKASSCPRPKMIVSDSCQVVFVGPLEYHYERLARVDPENCDPCSIGDDTSDDLDMYEDMYGSDGDMSLDDDLSDGSDLSIVSWASDCMLPGL